MNMNMEIKQQAQRWLKDRTQKERMYLLAGMLFVCFVIWFLVWESVYQDKQKSLHTEKQAIQEKIAALKIQNTAMKSAANSEKTAQKSLALEKQLQQMETRLSKVSDQMVSSSVMTQALKSVLAETPDLTLLRLVNTSNVDLASLSVMQHTNLYQHNFTLEFEGNYFAVLEYLKKIEHLPFRFYSDSVSYTVTQYPLAKVTLKLHTISKEKDFINA